MKRIACLVFVFLFVIDVSSYVHAQPTINEDGNVLCIHRTTGKPVSDIYQGIDAVVIYIQSKNLAENIMPINEFEEIIKETIVSKYKNCNPDITVSFVDDPNSELFSDPKNFGMRIHMRRNIVTNRIEFNLSQYRNIPISFSEYISYQNNLTYRGSIELHSEKNLNQRDVSYFLAQYLLYQDGVALHIL